MLEKKRLDGPWPANSVVRRHMATANILVVSREGRLRVDYLVNGGKSQLHVVQIPVSGQAPDIKNVLKAMDESGADASADERESLRRLLSALVL